MLPSELPSELPAVASCCFFLSSALQSTIVTTMKTRKRPLLSFVTTASLYIFTDAFLGIPGNIASENGYDAGGNEQVCWLGRSSNAYNSDLLTSLLVNVQPMDNPLIENFSTAGQVELYPSCPSGTSLQIFPPRELGEIGAVTHYNYTFVVNGTLDMQEWPTDSLVTDNENVMEAVIHVSICCTSNVQWRARALSSLFHHAAHLFL